MTLTDADVAITAAEAGARVVARTYGGEHVHLAKSATDFATETDIEAEQAILAVLAEHRPGDARSAEESGDSGSHGATRRWLVDPLCGTLNFAAGTPLVVVNVALVDRGADIAAAAADPISEETFWTDGQGAFRRDRDGDQPLRPTAVSNLVEINCDGPLERPFVGGQLVGDPLLRAKYGPRVISSTLGVSWVAAGRRAAYVSDGDFVENVHFAAGLAICAAAGCLISDFDGNAISGGRGLVVSADARTHEDVLALVGPHARETTAQSG